jgi:hypothetical protein
MKLPAIFACVGVVQKGQLADEVQKVEESLNNRPRTVLGYRTPLEVFSKPRFLQRVALAS